MTNNNDNMRFKTPSGAIFSLLDSRDGELYATFDLTGDGGGRSCWEPFNVARGAVIEETTRVASRADTSLVKTGDSGLPQDWEALIFGWRAVVEGPKEILESDELAAWAAATSCQLHYNMRPRCTLQLSELLRAPMIPVDDAEKKEAELIDAAGWLRNLARGFLTIPIHIRCGLMYGVEVQCGDLKALLALRARLKTIEKSLMVRIYLRGFLKTPIA